MQYEFDKEKFKALVHFIAWKAGTRDWFGATKLNKVLWFADARQYALTGKPITGETYVREKHGPVPQHIMPVRRELEREGLIKFKNDAPLSRVVSLVPFDRYELFSGAELATAVFWIDYIDKEHTAGSISDMSHDYAWEIAKIGEELPLFAYRVGRIQEPTDEVIARLRKRAEALGLN
jgi:hypothetical protein